MRTDELRFTAAQTMNLCLAQSSCDVSLVTQDKALWSGARSKSRPELDCPGHLLSESPPGRPDRPSFRTDAALGPGEWSSMREAKCFLLSIG